MQPKLPLRAKQRGFTLMELMIVLVIIGILMSGVFMLMSVAAKHSDVARTRARIQKVQNAISGFYAAYGTYPPVELHGPTNPFGRFDSEFAQGSAVDGSSLSAVASRQACRAQPVAFEFPYPEEMDKTVNLLFSSAGIQGANQVYQNAASIPDYSWSEVQMFKFGLMSYLLPRIQTVGVPGERQGFSQNNPIPGFFESEQWKRNNKTSAVGGGGQGQNLVRLLNKQRQAENREAAKWIPNLEGQVSGYGPTLFNIALGGGGDMNDPDMDGMLRARIRETDEPIDDNHPFRGPYSKGGGSDTVLYCATLKDAWDRDLFYHSAPPYQSYRLWSAGPDGNTFPPWVPLDSLSSADRRRVAGWIKDDIVGFDR
jgi:prepilin-type N-terminal cleavage/methylation domain-containing protein